VRGHKLRNCWVVDPLTSPTLHLANYVGIADSAFLENIDVDVSFICAGTTQSDWCALDFESPIAGAGAYPAYIRNINLKLNGVFPAGANQHIMFSIIKKVDGGSYDTQTRGYFVENVTVGGNVRLGQASSTLMNIMSSTNTGTWTTGEFVRNVAVKDLVVTGTSGGSASLVGYNAIVDAIKFENVTLPDGITYDGTAQRGTFYRNSLIGTTYYRDALVESSSASAVVTSGQRTIVELASDVASTASTAFQDVTGLAWTVVSGASYRFKATLMYYTSVATIGIRVSIAIPSVTHSAYHTEVSVGAANGANAAITFENWQTAADSGTTSADSMTTTGGNLCTIEGIIKPSAGGVLQIRFAPETATASGVIIKAGSTLEVW
jgi:hypothetical protein